MTTENLKINSNGPWHAGLARDLLRQGIGAVIAVLLLVGMFFGIDRWIMPIVRGQATAVVEELESNGKKLDALVAETQKQTVAADQVLDIITTDPEDREQVRNRIKAERRGR